MILRAAFSCALLTSCTRGAEETFRTERASRGPITEIVNATGDVQALIIVNVGSQVSGTIARLHVDFNTKVKSGQLLAELDPRLFRAQLEKAEAGLASAQANAEKARATFNDSDRQEKRIRDLFAQRLVSQSDLDTAVTAREANAAAWSAARAQILQAKAERDTAATNLAFTRITSPIDGIVVSRAVDVGQTVAAAFQAPTLFTIANDLTKMQILANIDEADVGKVHEGQAARFTVDAYPGEVFQGSIREVRQAPTTIQNVVTYAAVIDAPNPERKLRQGMTAAVQVTTDRHDDAVRIPNAALRFKPANASAVPAARRAEPTMARTAAGSARGSSAAGPGLERAPLRGRSGRVWKLVGGKPLPTEVRIGLSDGQVSEVFGDLKEGDEVIVGEAGPGAAAPQQRRRGPF